MAVDTAGLSVCILRNSLREGFARLRLHLQSSIAGRSPQGPCPLVLLGCDGEAVRL